MGKTAKNRGKMKVSGMRRKADTLTEKRRRWTSQTEFMSSWQEVHFMLRNEAVRIQIIWCWLWWMWLIW